MATTTNYGWTTPDDTALVKDGAAAIRSLGSSIDTSLNTALGTKKAGLVLLNTTSFSAVSSQSVNDVFSSTYDNYRIVLQISSCSVSPVNITMKYRKAGTDNSSAYYYSGFYTTFAGASGIKYNGTNQSSMVILSAGSTFYTATFDVINPRITKARITGTSASGGPHDIGVLMVGYHDVTDTFDGFTLAPASGNMTGNVSVYGYNK